MRQLLKYFFVLIITCATFTISSSQAENHKPTYVKECEEQHAFVSIFPPGMMDDLIKNTRDNYKKQKEAQARDGGGSISEKEFEEHTNKLIDPEAKEKEEAQKKIDECISEAEAKAGNKNKEENATMDEAAKEIGKEIDSALDNPPTLQDGERTAISPAIITASFAMVIAASTVTPLIESHKLNKTEKERALKNAERTAVNAAKKGYTEQQIVETVKRAFFATILNKPDLLYNKKKSRKKQNIYNPPPKSLTGFPDAKRAKPKGGRARWKDSKGRIIEWDSQHGTVEVLDKTGKKHLGEFDPKTGKKLKDGKKDRQTEK